MKQPLRVAAVALLLLVPGASQAQELKLADGSRYASAAAYYVGTWKWERPEPRQTAITRLGADGSFFFHNLTIDLQHWGTYSTAGQNLSLTLLRSCEDKGSNCENRKDLEYAIAPTTANVFMANAERWERMK